MSDLVRRVTFDRLASKKKYPDFTTGDTVGIYVKVKEGEKERVQLYSGVVLKIQGSGASKSFTVRKIASGVGVERTFPMLSPIIDRIELISRGKVRRSRLFYLRGLKGRSARLESEVFVDHEAIAEAKAAEAAQPSEPKAPKAPKEKKAKAAKAKK